MNGLRRTCARIVDAPAFNGLIIAMILITALGLGVETSQTMHAEWGHAIRWAFHVALAVFVIEAAIKLTAVAPRFERYFRDGWNLFDFTILVLALLPEAGEFALIARLARLAPGAAGGNGGAAAPRHRLDPGPLAAGARARDAAAVRGLLRLCDRGRTPLPRPRPHRTGATWVSRCSRSSAS